ncbi:DUF1801 domain-containing protein [Aliifodinibius sp. S!AR15-10]|uniref:iron chaperone n=1 Tax=Aliifodinibius sp. S!AR15-10 TaxID=2950437 RepID=UPI002854DA0E|nr:DUF1801 domain-containing protein [Aliifodinibius sp. S!AR15-10]MDR8393733.1 DUF1801 domain-containing protein [Aliifodinibius sp. S!AR15-10]
MAKSNLETIDEYINTFPEDVQKQLREVRECIEAAAPQAHEKIKWSRPAYSDDERILVMFAAFKHHIGFYVTPSTLQAFEEDLSGFKTGKGSIQIPLEQELPTDLIRKLTQYRVWESREKGVNWKS